MRKDVPYVNFKKPSHADDSELADEDVLIRYKKKLRLFLDMEKIEEEGTFVEMHL